MTSNKCSDCRFWRRDEDGMSMIVDGRMHNETHKPCGNKAMLHMKPSYMTTAIPPQQLPIMLRNGDILTHQDWGCPSFCHRDQIWHVSDVRLYAETNHGYVIQLVRCDQFGHERISQIARFSGKEDAERYVEFRKKQMQYGAAP